MASSLDDPASIPQPHTPEKRLLSTELRATGIFVRALAEQNLLTVSERDSLLRAIEQIASDTAEADFRPEPDVFALVGARLHALAESAATRLDTLRAEDERTLTVLRLWLIDEISALGKRIAALQKLLIEKAEGLVGSLILGHVRQQPVQVISGGHWLLCFFWMLARDQDRLASTIGHASSMPLGSDSLAGTAHRIDRRALADVLGLGRPTPNSVDAVTDADFAAEFLFVAALLGSHLARCVDEIHLYRRLGFINLKTLPEIRPLAARLYAELPPVLYSSGALDRILIQKALVAAIETLSMLIRIVADAVEHLDFDPDPMLDALDDRVFQDDLVQYLVRHSVTPDEARKAVENLLQKAAKASKSLAELPLGALKTESPAFEEDVFAIFDNTHAVAQRANIGGTAPAAIREQIREALDWLVEAGFA